MLDIVDSDEAVARRAQAGQSEAFAELFRRHHAGLCALIGRYLASADEAHDVVQDVFVDLFTDIAGYDSARPFLPWLRTVCLNRLHRRLREISRRGTRAQRLLDEALVELAAGEEERPPDDGQLAALRRCLDRLEPDHRALLDARYAQGWRVEDLAADRAEKPNTIAVRLRRLRDALRRCVDAGVPPEIA